MLSSVLDKQLNSYQSLIIIVIVERGERVDANDRSMAYCSTCNLVPSSCDLRESSRPQLSQLITTSIFQKYDNPFKMSRFVEPFLLLELVAKPRGDRPCVACAASFSVMIIIASRYVAQSIQGLIVHAKLIISIGAQT